MAFWRCPAAYARDSWENVIPPGKLSACSDDLDPDFSPPTRQKASAASGREHYNIMQCCDTHFTIPFPLLGSVTLPCAGHYWVGISMAHLKMSSVLCSSTKFVFPLRSNSCKAPGSASGIRISVNSLQLKSTNCSIKKSTMTKKIFSVLLCDQFLQCSVQTSYDPTTDCIPKTGNENGSYLSVEEQFISSKYLKPAIARTPILKE